MSMILVRHFFHAKNAADAVIHQLDLYNDLLIFRKFDQELADAIIKRLQRHLWYSCEEFVVFSIVSELISDDERAELGMAIHNQPTNQLKPVS